MSALEDTVNKVLAAAIDGATRAGDFLKEQIPDILRQLLAWSLASDAIIVALTAVAVFVGLRATLRWTEQGLEYDTWHTSKVLAASATAIAGTIGIFASVVAIFDAAKILIAPKLWLLEYGASLLKGAH